MTNTPKDWALDALDALETDYADTRDRFAEAQNDFARGAITATDYEEISSEFWDAKGAFISAAIAADRLDLIP